MNPEEFQRELAEATDSILIAQCKIQSLIFPPGLDRNTTLLCTKVRDKGLGIEVNDRCFVANAVDGKGWVVPFLRPWASELEVEQIRPKPMLVADLEGFMFVPVPEIVK